MTSHPTWFSTGFYRKRNEDSLESGRGFRCICALFDRFYVFVCPTKEAKVWILEKGPLSLVGQLLALQPQWPSFRPMHDAITQARVWVRVSYLPLELWEPEN